MITHLGSRDFPFVRYRTGDIATLDDRPCGCGRTLPLIRDLQGRSTDFLVASDRSRVHALALIYVLRETPGIEAFRIVQDEVGRVRILLVAGESLTPELVRDMTEAVRARLGESTKVVVERVRELERERSGKFRYVISRASDTGGGRD